MTGTQERLHQRALQTATQMVALIIGLVLWQILSARVAQAQLSPGDLAAPHSAFEGLTNCTECHEIGKGPSADKCLSCHTGVKASIETEKGYHYRVVKQDKRACFSCHSDHSGKEFKLIHWENGIEKFEHQLAGYALKGKHESLECRNCHKPDFAKTEFLLAHQQVNLSKTFLGLTDNCLSCHGDEHRGQLGADCQNCHGSDHWTPARGFEHDKAKFTLVGKHATVQCQKCHKPLNDRVVISPAGVSDSAYSEFTGLSFGKCVSCHTDPHQSKLGDDCLKCHSQKAWSPASGFDHSSTKFALTGKHKSVLCEKCHKSVGAQKVSSGKSGKVEDAFAAYKGLEFGTCESCHTDVHQAKLGKDCQSCHKTNGWNSLKSNSFDHGKTEYPLLGKHKAVKCQSCHKTGVKDAKTLKSEHCTDCHSDTHKGQFADRSDGGACESCHTVSGFAPSQFTIERHNQESAFKLAGAHLAQPCPICHVTPKKGKGAKVMKFSFEKTDCVACHSDIHFGQFTVTSPEKGCVDCHGADAWQELVFDHNRDSKYVLEGAHAQTLCQNCHKTEKRKGKRFVRYRPLDSACKSCHSLETLELLKQK